ncbi:translation initiation factor IF-3 [Erysipelotrichaceae bacterium]|uniref:translation initiation factor IF-3 n=1 Tax=unclassified Bulleidia TaxID=2704656 RepID=UPI0015B5A086|nr:translation initiation factor IF-3 [Erysipelotrichaceae bacterium 7770_A6]MDD7059018.1 translation initiation factor IF-3 [Erysipelotrichaceae bacterium]MDY3660717.1 translation initiation factor IF-3 [Bulleidia sp.]MEE0559103.1 translation initiation factor IF-3 [Bulleidia sp.]
MGKVKFNKNRHKEPTDIVNEAIRDREVLVIGSDGTQLGVMSRRDALQKAYDEDLDLLCVAPNAQPPVCKIIDYGRYRFEQQKKEREAKKNQQTAEMKSLRVSPVIDQHDFDTKVKRAKEWLSDGQKVKIDMRFRGRMITRQEVGKQVLDKFTEQVSDVADVTKPPMLEGNTMSVTFSPKKGK